MPDICVASAIVMLKFCETILVPTSIHPLSKSRSMVGLHCECPLWLLVNRPEDNGESLFADQRRMQFGTEFGREATRLFSGGVEVRADYRDAQQALNATATLLGSDAPLLPDSSPASCTTTNYLAMNTWDRQNKLRFQHRRDVAF
jgi:hypothetical protein